MAKKNTPKPVSAKPKAKPAPSSPNSTPTDWYPWALALAALLLYASGFSNPMVAMDDHTATVDNPAVKNFDLLGGFNLGMYAPVTWFFYAIGYRLNGGTDSGTVYHVMSALVHAANVFLVYRLLRQWEAPLRMSALAALIFAIHPLQVEAVSWIAGFSTPLFVFFSLISLQWWTQHVRTGSAWGQTYWLALLALVAACLSKSAAVMLPLSLLVLDIWWKRPLLKNALEKIPFFAVSLGFGVLTLVSRVHEGHVTALDSVYTPFERFLMACHSVLFYWTKFILPTGLSIWYPFTKTAGGQLPLAYFIAPFLLAGILVFAWWKRKEWPLLWAGILFYLANIILALPFSTMGTFELRSDRYNYLAMLGLIAILCYIPLYLQQKKPALAKPAWGVLGGLMVFWLFATVQRIGEWKDTMILLNKSIERQGDNFGRAYYWRGMEWGDRAKSQKDWQRAIEDFSKALEINPELTECYKYRGALYGITNQFDKSVADLTEYLKVKPNDAEYRYNRGLSLLNLGRPAETVADMTQTLQDNPDFYQAYLTRSNAYQMLGDAAKAQQDMEAYQRMAQMAGGK